MSKLIDLNKQRFGRLTVLGRMDNDKVGGSKWLCQCVCGTRTVVFGGHLRSGHTTSCGCLQKEVVTKHGHSTTANSQTYRSWDHMIQRCNNINNKYYHNYGGRGITVCQRWENFTNFLEDMGERPSGLTLDRIKNDKGYCKSNCQWATRKQQQRNRRTNRLLSHNGKTQCLIEWSEDTGISTSTIKYRLHKGWSTKKALTTPVQKKLNKGKS